MNKLKSILGWSAVITAIAVFAYAPVFGQPVSERQLFSLIQDGDAVDTTTAFGQLLAGYDGTNAQLISVDTSGQLQVDVLSGGGAAEDFTLGDNASDPSDVQPVASFPMLFDGTNYDRLRGNPNGDDRNPTGTMLTSSSFGMVYDATDGNWDRWAAIDDTADTGVGLVAISDGTEYAAVDTNNNVMVSLGTALSAATDTISIEVNDVQPQLDDTDKIATSMYGTGTGTAGDTSVLLNDQGAVITGYIEPSANSPERLSVSGTSGCTSAITVGLVDMTVEGGTDDVIHCCHVGSATCTADQNDRAYFSSQTYKILVNSDTDIYCCVSGNSGTAIVTFDVIATD